MLIHINLHSSSIYRCLLSCGSAVTLLNSYLAFRLVITLPDILDFITLCFLVINCLISEPMSVKNTNKTLWKKDSGHADTD